MPKSISTVIILLVFIANLLVTSISADCFLKKYPLLLGKENTDTIFTCVGKTANKLIVGGTTNAEDYVSDH